MRCGKCKKRGHSEEGIGRKAHHLLRSKCRGKGSEKDYAERFERFAPEGSLTKLRIESDSQGPLVIGYGFFYLPKRYRYFQKKIPFNYSDLLRLSVRQAQNKICDYRQNDQGYSEDQLMEVQRLRRIRVGKAHQDKSSEKSVQATSSRNQSGVSNKERKRMWIQARNQSRSERKQAERRGRQYVGRK